MTGPTSEERERRLAFGRQALAIAYDRLNILEKHGDPDLVEVGAAAAECLVWICALGHGRNGTLMTAMRWARNAALHELLVRAEKATDGIFVIGTSLIGGPDLIAHSRWAERPALGPVRRSKPEGEIAYDAELAGQPVLSPIREARALLDADFADRVAHGWA